MLNGLRGLTQEPGGLEAWRPGQRPGQSLGVGRPSLRVLGAGDLGSVGVIYSSADGHTDVWTDKIQLCILNDTALLVKCPKIFDRDI